MISGVNAKVPVIYTLFPIDEAQLISTSTKIFTIVKGKGEGCVARLGTGSSLMERHPAVPANSTVSPWKGPSGNEGLDAPGKLLGQH